MHQSFVSVVTVIQSRHNVRYLDRWLSGLFAVLQTHFTDYEFVLVNNHVELAEIDEAIKPLPEALRKNVFLLNLSAKVSRDNAIMAGLDRANGDYTVIFELDFWEKPHLILQLWEKSQTGFDIVYLRARERSRPWLARLFYAVFYGIMKRYSGLTLDPQAHISRLISRRALNSLLRLRENSHYLKANFALVGYNATQLQLNEAHAPDEEMDLGRQFRTALVAVTSYTTFLRSLLLWIFLASVLFALVAISNAVAVKLFHVDIWGNPQEALSGWAFLVVLISAFFAITCLNLYIMSIYLSNIYNEIKNRPLYIIESVKRY